MVSDDQDVVVYSWRDQRRADRGDADVDAGTFGQRHVDDRLTDSLSLRLPRLAIQTMAKPRSSKLVRTDPPINTLQHGLCAGGDKEK